jgi:hypothetical protein
MSLEGKSEEQIKSLADQLLAKLQEKGGVAGNVSLVRELSWDEDTYWPIRDRLVDAGQLQLGRGKGGSDALPKSCAGSCAEHEPAHPAMETPSCPLRPDHTQFIQVIESCRTVAMETHTK